MARHQKTKHVAASETSCNCGPTRKEVEMRAYHNWEKHGKPHGRDHEHWSHAETELRAEYKHHHEMICERQAGKNA